MNRIHTIADDELRDRAALYVIGSLSDDEARSFRQHLGDCAVCRVEVEALEALPGELLELAPSVPPPAGLWQRVLERAREPEMRPDPRTVRADGSKATQIWKAWNDAPGAPFTYVEQRDSGFEPTNVPGIHARKLFVDPAHDRVTMLVRMEPGAAYPGHRHSGPEDCYVLQGDLVIEGERTLHGGDYVRAAPGSVHGVQSTRNGNLLLIVSSLGDELTA